MKLKWQISIIAFLSLSFPLVVWLAFKTLNQTYQDNMLVAANKQSQVILNSVEQFYQDRKEQLAGWYISQLGSDPRIDGQTPEWEQVPWDPLTAKLRLKIAKHQQKLHLLIEVADDSVFIDINQPSDRLILALGEDRGIKRITINRQAEGPVFNQIIDTDYKAYWHEISAGYQVEIAIEQQHFNRFGLAAIDHHSATSVTSYGTLEDDQIQLSGFFEPLPQWTDFLTQITPDDSQLTLKDPLGRIFYQTGDNQPVQPAENWLTEIFYELAFDSDQNDGSHFFGQQSDKTFSAGSIELTIRHTDAQLALIQTFIQSIFWIFLIALTLLLGYFLYALVLAWRIRRLNKTLQHVIDDKGKIKTTLPSNGAKDEIGDLSRGMSSLLSQINDYTEYLKQLGSRLSHEMKTPISIVHTSLEVLHMEQPDNEFVNRALTANNRLKFILNQLSALSRLKQSIAETEVETFDINAFIMELGKGYQLTCQQIKLIPSENTIMVTGAKELYAQLLDKLVQNAMDFIGSDDEIIIAIQLIHKHNQFRITVSNTGSQIPEQNLPQLFDSLSSFRTQKSDTPHLGLGLYIAKLIADFHQTRLDVKNIDDPLAVEFSLSGHLAQ